MSSISDPAKLKVVELRAELTKRGLDSKGNKPALVKRLKDALEEELKQELPDTSIADTSTEDLDSSQKEEPDDAEDHTVPDSGQPDDDGHISTEEPQSDLTSNEPEKMDTDVVEPESTPEPTTETAPATEESAEVDSGKPAEEQHIENGDQEEPKSRKSRWGSNVAEDVENKEEEQQQEVVQDVEKTVDENEPKGEKRKHSSPSPERVQRKRSKSPIKEDEPPIDNDKVQLSWYDSDLHLQLDKESFLSAKPYHDGAFGFAWAGVRATHGVNSGKVCYEVKITEELKWEDFSKYYERNLREIPKHDKKQQQSEEKKSDDTKENKQLTQSENGESNATTESEEKKNDDESMETQQNDDKAETEKSNEELPETKTEEQSSDVKSTEAVDESKEEEKIETEPTPPEPPIPTHLFRVGWSVVNSKLQLGEEKYSYGYESTGRFVTDKQFSDYGIKYGVGDVVTTFLDINEEHFTISYAVNNEVQTEAIKVLKSELPDDFVLFPHVSSRNYAFELNLGSKEEAWFEKPESFADYEFLENIGNKVPGPIRPETRSDCEVILMCGLPASGKTHWVEEYVQANPDKKYTLLGNSQLLEKMTVSGDTLKSKYKGRWNVLLDKLQKCLNKMIEIAALRRRNYIIDQTNVFPSAQRRKLRPFEGFKRRAVVVVVGDEEQAKRQSLQEAQGGKDVPDSAVLEMKANMNLPQKGDWLDEVLYVGLEEAEAKAQIQKYNTQGKEAGYGGQKRFGGHRDDRHRWQNRRNDYRGGNYRDRSYQSGRYDRGPPRQNWHPQRPGGWNRDRRDNRGPPGGGSRDWRNRGSSGRDRGNRDNHGGQVSNYSRSRNPPAVRGPGGGSGGGSWQSGSGGWGHQNQGWGSQPWSGQGSWSSSGQNWSQSQSQQNQWKYGGGSQTYGSYSNWNYYSQYPQNWNAQGQSASTGSTTANAGQYGQYSQQEWAQYAQQYAQQGQNTSITPAAPQK